MTRRTQQGVALVVVMLVVAMATTVVTFMAQQQGFWQRELENSRDRTQARYIAQAGVDWARAVLADDAVSSQSDHGRELWTKRLPTIPLDNGEVEGLIEDMQGKYNLNNLVQNGHVNPQEMARLLRLLDTLGLPQALAATLADWMDEDSTPQPGGAEDGDYLSLPHPYRAANRPLSELAELVWVKGFDARVIARLESFVSVLPESGSAVNVNFAPAEVLAALIPGLPLQAARQLVEQRGATPFKTMDDFLRQLPTGARQENNMGIRVTSQYFMVTGRARIGQGHAAVQALLSRTTSWPTVVRQSLQ